MRSGTYYARVNVGAFPGAAFPQQFLSHSPGSRARGHSGVRQAGAAYTHHKEAR